jgi:mediator of RNA polymerase II transcription subunit 13
VIIELRMFILLYSAVILAPYGLAGTLTGQVSRMDSQLLEEWKHFYPISTGNNPETGLPPLVEVLIGGVRMRYPSCYVLVTDMDDTPSETPLSPPSSPVTYERPLLTQQELSAATELPERVWAECTLSSPVPASKIESSTEPGTWTFVEPTQKSSCTCSCLK